MSRVALSSNELALLQVISGGGWSFVTYLGILRCSDITKVTDPYLLRQALVSLCEKCMLDTGPIYTYKGSQKYYLLTEAGKSHADSVITHVVFDNIGPPRRTDLRILRELGKHSSHTAKTFAEHVCTHMRESYDSALAAVVRLLLAEFLMVDQDGYISLTEKGEHVAKKGGLTKKKIKT